MLNIINSARSQKNARNKNGQPISKRLTGRPKIRWEDDVKKRYTEVKDAKLEGPCPG